MYRKARLIICLVVFLIMVLLYHVMMDNKSTDVCAMCKNSLDKSYNEVVALIHTHQGEFLNKGNDEFKSFAALFDELISVDLRGPSDAVFSFRAPHPEVTLQLIYRSDDHLLLQSDISLTEDTNELRIDNLGIRQSGYLSNNKLYVTQAEIISKLIIGRFAFEPQANGNLSLIYNG